MSKELTKQELVRLSWLTELRRQGDRQCFDFGVTGGRVCALELLAEICGEETKEWHAVHHEAGLTSAQSEEVWELNDSGTSFSEIADVVEGWFKKGE